MNLQTTNIYADQCRYCGKQFDVNHGNRKFCKPPSKTEKENGKKDCKVTYNNSNAKRIRDIVNPINKPTIKNLIVLEYFFIRKRYTVTRDQLLFKGFVFGRCTGSIKNSIGEIIGYEYYNFQLIKVDDKFLIQKK